MTPEYNLILILMIAALNAFTAWTTMQSKKTIVELEKNTNSIKDALVAATSKAALAEGTAIGLQQGRDEVAIVSEPVKVEITNIPPTLKA